MRDRAYRKADATLWHDAYSLAYIQKMQRADAKNVIDTGCLFLSTDQRLMSLQREDSEFKNRPVVAIVPSQLLQMFAFTRPDEGYEETFIKFFASSSIGVSFDYSNNDIEEILFRIAHYIDKQPEIARTILSRELLNSHYKNADTDEEKEEIVYKDISDALLNELNVSKAQLVETEADREKKSKELDEVNKAIETNQVQFEKEKEQLRREIAEEKASKELERKARLEISSENDDISKKVVAQEEYVIDNKMRVWIRKKRLVLGIGIALFICIAVCTGLVIKCSKNAAWLGLLALLGIDVYVIISGGKIFSVAEKEKVREAFMAEYRREIEKRVRQ